MELQGEERLDVLGVLAVDGVDGFSYGLLELLEGLVMPVGEAGFLHAFPGSLYEVEVGGIWRQEEQLYVEQLGHPPDHAGALVGHVVQDHGDGRVGAGVLVVQVDQKGADGLGVDAALVLAPHHPARRRVERAEPIEALAAAGAPNPLALAAPAVVRIAPEEEVRGVHEVNLPLAALGLLEAGLELIRKKIHLHLPVCLARQRSGLAEAHAQPSDHHRPGLAGAQPDSTEPLYHGRGLFGGGRRALLEHLRDLLDVLVHAVGRTVAAVLHRCAYPSLAVLVDVGHERGPRDLEGRADVRALDAGRSHLQRQQLSAEALLGLRCGNRLADVPDFCVAELNRSHAMSPILGYCFDNAKMFNL